MRALRAGKPHAQDAFRGVLNFLNDSHEGLSSRIHVIHCDDDVVELDLDAPGQSIERRGTGA
jgi:DNA polymerase II small subunit/DNA polymerase delta subunit B